MDVATTTPADDTPQRLAALERTVLSFMEDFTKRLALLEARVDGGEEIDTLLTQRGDWFRDDIKAIKAKLEVLGKQVARLEQTKATRC